MNRVKHNKMFPAVEEADDGLKLFEIERTPSEPFEYGIDISQTQRGISATGQVMRTGDALMSIDGSSDYRKVRDYTKEERYNNDLAVRFLNEYWKHL